MHKDLFSRGMVIPLFALSWKELQGKHMYMYMFHASMHNIHELYRHAQATASSCQKIVTMTRKIMHMS